MQARATRLPAHPSLREHRVALRPLAYVDSLALRAIPAALRGATGARLQNMQPSPQAVHGSALKPVPAPDARDVRPRPAQPLPACPPRPLQHRDALAAFRVVRLSYRRWDMSDCPSHQSIRASLGRALTASRVETSAPGVAPLMRLAIHAAVCLSRRMSDVQPLNPD